MCRGWSTGTITDVDVVAGVDKKNKPFRTLKLVGRLDDTDDTGKAFTVERVYNLEGRGTKEFAKDVLALTGKELTREERARFSSIRHRTE